MVASTPLIAASLLVAAAFLAESVSAHGVVFSPPARNYYCGYITKPDQVQYPNGNPTYPQCADAFNSPLITSQGMGNQQGYNYMSFATHNQGFLAVGRTKFVCSMESDYSAFAGNITYQDLSINWPTSTINSGPYSFVWDTRWGNHYGDTNEFVYWITKPDFVYTVGMNLTWDHFDTTPFCRLPYTHGVPNDYVTIDSGLTVFTTKCTIPARTGRHIIKAEWGRTPPTNERFHGCIDVIVNSPGGSGTTTTTARSSTTTTTTTTTRPASTTTTTTTTRAPTTTTTTTRTTTTTTTTRPATTTTTTTTTTRTTTTTVASPSPSPIGSCAALYAQCGGSGWTGATCCATGKCTVLNAYYSQCTA